VPVYALGDQVPEVDPGAYVHPDAVVIGSVTIAAEASIWPTAVLRGDIGAITVGPRSSVQDGTVVHAGPEYPTVIGAGCVVGHNAYLEGCVLEDGCLVGSMASVLPRAVVGKRAVVAAGAVVTADVRPFTVVGGIPAREIAEVPRDVLAPATGSGT
jgi:carbonic anhydrase/acetyltransferase-like protein (isoleucine patch superfamily)